VLADAFEAIIGAIYLDSDFVTARRVLLHTRA
jgi:dsRNA-specific ribonuclease